VSVLTVIYAVATIWISLYGFNAFLLIFLYLRNREPTQDVPPLSQYPVITVQLPVFNERYVVRRAIGSLVRLDWPRDRLQIQVLDDSTDDTTTIARQCVERYRRRGFNVALLHRNHRAGYKSGALNNGMQNAEGEFIAIFDADFVPSPDFLQRTVPHLIADPGLGFVQARWGHLNDEFSLFTMAQAIALDGHFAVEHVARERANALTNFNGTAGVWRRSCIEESGGWDTGMLTEDVDLSYRAQLAGWKGLTLTDVVAPAEVPAQLAAFKRQQFRWAKGNMQCLMRHGPALLRAPLSSLARLQALIHLTYYLAHPLLLIVMGVTLPLLWYDLLDGWPLAIVALATFGPPSLYVLGQRTLYRNWWQRLKAMPVLICLGTGLALNSTAAICEAALGIRSVFERTPKFRIEGREGGWQDRPYTLPGSTLLWGEFLCALYSLLIVYVVLRKGDLQALPFLLLYTFGFGFISIVGLVQAAKRDRSAAPRAKAERGPAS
jgi:cellulose synthase/poly-beta-1,6-N-acetylglucosamine synthase-like glycosyltransferase